MDLRTIRTFQTIVELGSFHAAAEHLNYAQSTITLHIKKLEKELGVTLFDRNQNFQLTPAGLLFKTKGQVLLKAHDHMKLSFEEMRDGQSAVIRLGVMEPTASYRLPFYLKKLYARFPKVQVTLQIHGSQVLAEMVARNEVDAAICSPLSMTDGTVFERIWQEDMVLLVPNSHRLRTQDTVSLADIQQENLVITNRFCPFRGAFEQEMLARNFLPSYGMEVSNMLTLKYYVAAGFGPAIVPFVAVNPPPEGTIIRRIGDFQTGLTVGIMKKVEGSLSPPLEALLKLIKEETGGCHYDAVV